MGPPPGRTTKAAASALAARSRRGAPAARMSAAARGARERGHEQGKRQLYCQEPHREGFRGRRVPRRLRYRSRAHDLAGSVELDPQQLQPLLVMPPQPEDADWSATVPEDVGKERERGVAESGGVAQIHGNVLRAAQGALDLQSRRGERIECPSDAPYGLLELCFREPAIGPPPPGMCT